MHDPGTGAYFIGETQKHLHEAKRYGRMAFQSFIATVVSFTIFAWRIEDSWCWWFWWASIPCGMAMLGALQERWFHRSAARVSYAFHIGDYDYRQPYERR